MRSIPVFGDPKTDFVFRRPDAVLNVEAFEKGVVHNVAKAKVEALQVGRLLMEIPALSAARLRHRDFEGKSFRDRGFLGEPAEIDRCPA